MVNLGADNEMYIDNIFRIKGRECIVDLHMARAARLGRLDSIYFQQGKHVWKLVSCSSIRYMKTINLEEIICLSITIRSINGAPERPLIGEVELVKYGQTS